MVLVVKNLTANAGDIRDVGLIPESGRSPGGGHGSPLQHSCLENFLDSGSQWVVVYRVTKSQARTKRLSLHACKDKLDMKVIQSCPTLWSHRLDSPWNYPGQNTGVGSCSLLQGIIPTQILNPGLLHCRWILYQLNHQGSPSTLKWGIYEFTSGSSWPRNWTRVFCIAGRFFATWAPGKPI